MDSTARATGATPIGQEADVGKWQPIETAPKDGTAILIWNPSSYQGKGAGYRIISVLRRRYLAHRLAWLYVHGELPPDCIDHVNGLRDDNRLVNLRPATKAENMRNRRSHRNNKSGHKGVSWDASSSKWRAQIAVNGKITHLGLFVEARDASQAYAEAAVRLHGKFAAQL